MPRHDLKAYTTVLARIPQELADQVKQYAMQHRCSVSELIRDGLEMRLESGDVPGRTTGHHGEEVLQGHTEVLQGITEVLHTLKVLAPMGEAAVRQTLSEVLQEVLPSYISRQQAEKEGHTEVLHGTTSLPQPHTQGMPSVLPFEIPCPASTREGITEVLQKIIPPLPSTDYEGLTAVIQTITQPAPEVLPGDTSTPQPHAPLAGQGHTEVSQEVLPPMVPTIIEPAPEVLHDKADFDATRFALGKLCVNGHAYGDTGQTLYRLPKYVCPPCDAARARERRARRQAVPPQEG